MLSQRIKKDPINFQTEPNTEELEMEAKAQDLQK